jgi:tRNA(Ile)-lysidine synthase
MIPQKSELRPSEGETANGLRIARLMTEGLRQRQPILVAVSGGVDSMVLLHLLHAAAPANGWRLTVAHLNHRLRGRSSDADERLVRRVAQGLGLPMVVGRADVRKLAARGGVSVEMAARKARHAFLAREAARRRIRTIALAHHADDQVELFFLRLLRGSGSQGLAGMKLLSPSPANPRILLTRPLLETTRREIELYARAHRISFREDASNASRDFQRNRVRHELLPLLRSEYQPALNQVIPRVMELVGAEAALSLDLAAQWLRSPPKHRAPFDHLPRAVQRRCLQLQLLAFGHAADFDLIEGLRQNRGQPFALPGGPARFALREGDGTVRVFSHSTPAFLHRTLQVPLKSKYRTARFAGTAIRWAIVSRRGTGRRSGRVDGAGKRAPRCECFDADAVGDEIILRHWQPGDRFQPIGMPRPIKLQDFFTNEKIPKARRHDLVVATTAQGEIFWVEGLRIGERFKLTSHTKRGLQWAWKRL